jgi:hypothetical protein
MRRRALASLVLGSLLLAMPAVAMGLTVDLQLESITVDSDTREVVLTGTLMCDAGATVTIGVGITQGREGAATFLNAFETFECSGAEQSWEIREPAGLPPVHPGPAALDFGYSAQLGEESIASGRSLEVFIAPAAFPSLFIAPAE